jgi:trk system potassium uptake protein TrkH
MGQLLRVEGLLMLLPLLCAVFYRESCIPFLIPILCLLLVGTLLCRLKPQDARLGAKDGFVIVALSWIVLSLFGMVPFLLSGAISSPVDAFFETVSGFTTTGASILAEIESLPKGILFWRSFTNWIGGMGVLVFVLALLPQSDMKNSRLFHVMRAEVPGPIKGKLVASLKHTALIMYAIYIVMTLLEFVLLLVRMSPYDAILASFSTAGTGGFSNMNASIAAFDSVYIDVVITVFMILFSINFNLYYLMLIGKFTQAIRSEEMWCFLGIYFFSVVAIACNLFSTYQSVGKAFRYSSFQVASVISTTGFATADFNQWPEFSQTILILLCFIGACAGSTGGGLKISRILILIKSGLREICYAVHPSAVRTVKLEGKAVDQEVVRSVNSYFTSYVLFFSLSVLLLSMVDNMDIVTNFTAVVSCLNNIGPGLNIVGPTGNFSGFRSISKILLSADMLFGRLELYPFLILFSPRTWRER